MVSRAVQRASVLLGIAATLLPIVRGRTVAAIAAEAVAEPARGCRKSVLPAIVTVCRNVGGSNAARMAVADFAVLARWEKCVKETSVSACSSITRTVVGRMPAGLIVAESWENWHLTVPMVVQMEPATIVNPNVMARSVARTVAVVSVVPAVDRRTSVWPETASASLRAAVWSVARTGVAMSVELAWASKICVSMVRASASQLVLISCVVRMVVVDTAESVSGPRKSVRKAIASAYLNAQTRNAVPMVVEVPVEAVRMICPAHKRTASTGPASIHSRNYGV